MFFLVAVFFVFFMLLFRLFRFRTPVVDVIIIVSTAVLGLFFIAARRVAFPFARLLVSFFAFGSSIVLLPLFLPVAVTIASWIVISSFPIVALSIHEQRSTRRRRHRVLTAAAGHFKKLWIAEQDKAQFQRSGMKI